MTAFATDYHLIGWTKFLRRGIGAGWTRPTSPYSPPQKRPPYPTQISPSISNRMRIWSMNSFGDSICGKCFVLSIPTISIDGSWFWYWFAVSPFSGLAFPTMIKMLLVSPLRQCITFAFVKRDFMLAYKYFERVLDLCEDSKQVMILLSSILFWS